MSDAMDRSTLDSLTTQPTPGKKALPPIGSNRTPVPIGNMFSHNKLSLSESPPVNNQYDVITSDNNTSTDRNTLNDSNNETLNSTYTIDVNTTPNKTDVTMELGELDTSVLVPDYNRSTNNVTLSQRLFNNQVIPATRIDVQPYQELYTPGQRVRILNQHVVITLIPYTIAFGLMLFSYVWLLYQNNWYQLTGSILISDWKLITGCILHCVATIIEIILLIQLLYNRTPFTSQTMLCYQIALTLYVFAVAVFTTPLNASDMIVPIQTPYITAMQAQWISCVVFGLLNIWLLYTAPHINVNTIIYEMRQLSTQALQKELRRLRSDGMQLNSTRTAIVSGTYIEPIQTPQNIFDLNTTQQSVLQSQLVDTSLQYSRPVTQAGVLLRSGTMRSNKSSRQQKDDLASGKIDALIKNTVRKMLHEQLQAEPATRSNKRSSKRSSKRRSGQGITVTANDIQAIHQEVLDQLHEDAAEARVNVLRFPTQNWT